MQGIMLQGITVVVGFIAGFILGALLTLFLTQNIQKIPFRDKPRKSRQEKREKKRYDRMEMSLTEEELGSLDEKTKKQKLNKNRERQTEAYNYAEQ